MANKNLSLILYINRGIMFCLSESIETSWFNGLEMNFIWFVMPFEPTHPVTVNPYIES